ncbi:MAG: integrase zinc binding domain-containing protein, partial [Pseudomonadota bacterium]|nr:integrase zinc binding domain-containing protein [Pseudomonadota bacterium]
MFLQCHTGMLGAHRNADKTTALILRQAWWATIKDDVKKWWQQCITCLRFRRMAQKQEQQAVIPVDAECWEEVMIDLEGPSNPADKQGNKYSMTYICCICHGVLTDRSPVCNSVEARRMFASCMLRSGTIPSLLRSDRGPELKNALMLEYTALIGLGRRFGTPWRPMEQGLVEGAHNETQKVMGMLVKDIMQCLPNECGELQYVVEFVVYNTPGPHGYTPRDIDRRWSLATPLERELQPFTVSEFEPVSEYVANLFRNYREIRVRVLGWLHASSTKRAELANRFRTSKKVLPGMQVVLRDPRHRKAGGRTPYRLPYSDPSEV